MGLQTYNRSIYRENGKIIYDADYDTLIDYKDPDTNNNGRNNLADANRKGLIESTYEILNGKYMTSSRDSLWENIKYRYGAMTSYRLISQIYFNQNRAIEPVLKELKQRKGTLEGYSNTDSYQETLYEYFNKGKSIRDLSGKVLPGKIFFIIDGEGKVVNLGITLDNQEVGIVLDQDTQTAVHTLEEVSNLYPDYEIKVQR